MLNSGTLQEGKKIKKLEEDFGQWMKRPRPNYGKSTNRDLKFPYSELPGDYPYEYPTVELPKKQDKHKILDFWGEGRIRVEAVGEVTVTGFPEAYNVNYQFQPVSNGPDKGKKIPNRIPTRDYDNVSVAKYVPSGSFHIITVMASPIHPPTAAEIARIISGDRDSMVVTYGYGEFSFIANLKVKLDVKNMVLLKHCPYLLSPLDEITVKPVLAFRHVDTVVNTAADYYYSNMTFCADILVSLQENPFTLSAAKALKDFFSRDEIKNNYKIFSLVDKLKATAEGRKLIDKYINTNVVKIAKSEYSSIKFKASLGETSYLCVNDKMGSGSTYEWAFFGTSSYINDKSRYRGGECFSLETYTSKTDFQIKSSHGNTSYLCTNGKVKSNDYRWALFGTPSYLSDSTYYNGQFFHLIPSNGGETFQVQATFGEPSYLCVNHHVETDGYRYAFFGTSDYNDADTSYKGGQHFTPVFQ